MKLGLFIALLSRSGSLYYGCTEDMIGKKVRKKHPVVKYYTTGYYINISLVTFMDKRINPLSSKVVFSMQ